MPVIGARYTYLGHFYTPLSTTEVNGLRFISGICVWGGRQRSFTIATARFMAEAKRVS